MSEIVDRTFQEIIDVATALRVVLERERLVPVTFRVPFKCFDTLLLTSEAYVQDPGLFGMRIGSWDEVYMQMETAPEFGRFVTEKMLNLK